MKSPSSAVRSFPASLASRQILDLWEEGRGLHPIDRALTILSAALPGAEWEELASLTIGERDAALLRLRRALFGDRLAGESRCPSCGQQVEFLGSVAEILASAGGPAYPGNRRGTLRLPEGRSLEFRLPDSVDLSLLVGADDPETARRTLAERCITGFAGEESVDSAERISEEILDLLSGAMEECDPLADIQFALVCPGCGNEWSVALDILSWLWEELSREARRLLYDVHLIARAYGWSEESILALSPTRRRTYIDMIV